MFSPSRAHLRPFLKLLLVLGLLGLADFLLIYRLVAQGHGEVVESNSVANWWLVTYGWAGLAVFKLGMFVVAGGMIGIIACYRPITGERLLLFCCGAQAAAVVYSVFVAAAVARESTNLPESLQSPLSRPEPALSNGWGRTKASDAWLESDMLLLLNEPSVQKELRLAEEQRTGLLQLADARRALQPDIHSSNHEDAVLLLQKMRERERAVKESLRWEQVKRLAEVAWQQRGPLTFSYPAVREYLELTTEQTSRIRGLLEESGRAQRFPMWGRGSGFGAPNLPEDDQARLRSKLLAVLTPTQTARWRELTGEPFEGEIQAAALPWMGLSRGPRRPGR